MGKTKNKIRVSFIGGNSESVTGSMTLIEFQNYKILLECGLWQSSDSAIENYKINNRRLPVKPKQIDYIFINHCHADHSLLLPRLYAEGFRGQVIVPKGLTKLFALMSKDSAYIMSKDAELIQRQNGIKVKPIYTEDDAHNCLDLFCEYDFNQKIELDENISFQFTYSGHIICSAQLELWLKNGNIIKKILYTSDLGNTSCSNYYIKAFQPAQKANLAICESTYSDIKRATSQKDRIKDLEKIKSIIDNACLENKSKVLIPIFSLARCQEIMTHIYLMYHEDKNFNLPILVDSPLAIKMCKVYSEILEDDQLKLWDEVMSWQNFRFINEYAESKEWMNNSEKSCCVLSASGFMQAGRSRQWAKSLLPNGNSHILFVGFASENSLAGKIKNYNSKTIKIDGKAYSNKCNVTDLKSFSSHMQRNNLLDYYSDLIVEKVALVHGEFKAKCNFAKELQIKMSDKNKTGRVVCVNKTTEILL
jgi:metallo-beta-lactamase family protein